METEHSFFSQPAAPWRSEPYRAFFPLGVVLGSIGVSHWLLYATGITSTYSCLLHGMVQVQAFMMAFAIGFLLTAVPRRTQTPPASSFEMLALAAALIITTAAALAESWRVAEAAYGLLFIMLLQFAVRRFIGRDAGRRPPAAFVLIPIGVLHGLGGAVLIGASTVGDAPTWPLGLGRLLIEQGVFLCFATGVGNLVLPLMAGAPPPTDLDSSPRERWRAVAFLVAGVTIFGSLLLEQLGWLHVGPLLRAAVVAFGLGGGGGAWRPPGKSGAHRQLVWLSVWMMPLGLVASGLWPDYRVPALHVLFIGGFGLLVFGVATHVALSHLGLEQLALGRPLVVIIVGVTFLMALGARVAADASSTYFDHLGWAAACWLVGSLAWLIYFGPKFLRR